MNKEIFRIQQLSGEVEFEPESHNKNNQSELYQFFLNFTMVAIAFLLVAYSG